VGLLFKRLCFLHANLYLFFFVPLLIVNQRWCASVANFFFTHTHIHSRAGTIQSLLVHNQNRHQPIRNDNIIMLYQYRWWWQPQKNNNYSETKISNSHFTFIQLRNVLSILSLILWYTIHHFALALVCVGICWIQCIDQPKTFTLLLKSKILDFETWSRVHFYRIKYVSYPHSNRNRLLTVPSQA